MRQGRRHKQKGEIFEINKQKSEGWVEGAVCVYLCMYVCICAASRDSSIVYSICRGLSDKLTCKQNGSRRISA